MPTIPGYRLREQLRQSAGGHVYLAERLSDGLPVVVKVLTEAGLLGPQTRVERERSLLEKLPSDGFCEAVETTPCAAGWALVLKRVPGEPLSDLIERGPLDLALFLDLAAGIATRIEQMHAAGVVHRDLKPSNLMWDPSTGNVVVIDVGIAASLGDPRLAARDQVEGSLPFMSPEQTGHVGTVADGRADLYSLGVTFYAMLTGGRLPFVAQSVSEWLHMHVAAEPIPLEEQRADLPVVIFELVHRLIEKAPGDRYQTAAGLLTDLQRCRENLTAAGEIPTFLLGSTDVATELSLSQTFEGRTEVLAQLDPALLRLSQTRLQVLAISGPGGSGKTAVLWRMHAILSRARRRIVFPQLDGHARQTPFGSLSTWLTAIADFLVAEAETRPVRSSLRRRLGGLADVLVVLAPGFAPLLCHGESGSARPLDTQPYLSRHGHGLIEFGNRMRQALCVLFEYLADHQRPLVLMLDDLDQADSVSLQALEEGLLAVHRASARRSFLCILSHQPRSTSHELSGLLPRLRTAGVEVHEEQLSGLSEAELLGMLTHALRVTPDRVMNLAGFLNERTDGTPGQVLNYLQHFIKRHVLRRGPGGGLEYRLDDLQSVGLPDEHVAALAHQLVDVTPSTRKLLGQAAHLSALFDLPGLCHVSGASEGEVADALEEGVQRGLLRLSEEGIMFASDSGRRLLARRVSPHQGRRIRLAHARYHFAHGRHLEHPQALLESAHVFAVEARELTPEERVPVAELQLCAARHAMSIGAFGQARVYVMAGLYLVNARGNRSGHPQSGSKRPTPAHEVPAHLADEASRLCFQLRLELGTTQAMSGDADAADATFRELAALEDTDHGVHANLYRAWVATTARRGDMERAVQLGLDGLARYQPDLPFRPSDELVGEQVAAVLRRVESEGPEAFVELPLATDPAFLAESAISTEVATPAFFCSRNLGMLNLMRMTNAMLDKGMTPDGPLRLMGAAAVYCMLRSDCRLGQQLGEVALHLNDTVGDRRFAARLGFLYQWVIRPTHTPLDQCLPDMRKVRRLALEAGDPETTLLAAITESTTRFMLGDHIDALRQDMERNLELTRRFPSLRGAGVPAARIRLFLLLQGRQPESVNAFDEASVRAYLDLEAVEVQSLDEFASVGSLASIALTFLGHHRLAFECAQRCRVWARRGAAPARAYKTGFALALAACRLSPELSGDERAACQATVDEVLAELRASPLCEQGLGRLVLPVLEGELAWSRGDFAEARIAYRKALEHNREAGYAHAVAFTELRLGGLSLQEGMPYEAAEYLERARLGFEAWGARSVADRIEAQWGATLERRRDTRERSASSSLAPSRNTHSFTHSELDTATLMRFTQKIIQQTDLTAVLETFLTTCIQTAGATSGALVLERDGRLIVEARGRAGGVFERVAIPMEDFDDLPRELVETAYDSAQSIYIVDAQAEPEYRDQAWFKRSRARSVTCLPILRQSRLVGLAFLENSLLPGVFAADKCQLIQHISVQAAVSLDNARLYAELSRSNAELEQRVVERTKALQAAKDQAEQARRAAVLATRAKSEFLASMSHEIRTPMNGVLGMAQLLATTELDAEQREFLQTIQESGEALLSIINDILDLSKIEAGKMELEAIEFNLHDCIEATGDMLAPKAQEQGLDLSVVIDPGVPAYAVGDAGRLRQLIINLANNAIKFTETGEVRVVARCETAGEELALHLEVVDTGIGIEPSRVDQLFIAFTQADASMTRRFGGTGLGLTISKRLAEAMGGEIGASSTEGEGSTFWFRVRLGIAERRQSLLPGAEAVRCLVYEPSEGNWQGVRAQLRRQRARVKRIDSISQVVDEVAQGHPESTLLLVRVPLSEAEDAALRPLLESLPLRVVMMAPVALKATLEHEMKDRNVIVVARPMRSAVVRRCLSVALGRGDGESRAPELPSTLGGRNAEGDPYRILIVEDNRVNQMLAARMLKKLGYDCDVVENGRDAVSAVTSPDSRWDLILMDCQMPEMDGFEASKRIRERELLSGGHIPIVALTANAMKGDEEACLSAGMNDYLSKPIDIDKLAETLHRHLEEANQTRQPRLRA